jgi:hypothetical protein
MKVQAAPGTKCPMETNPRSYLTDAEPIDVPESPYYRRLIADGSLVEPPAQEAKRREVKADGK